MKRKMFTRGKAAPTLVDPVPHGRAQLIVDRVAPLTATAAERVQAAAVLLSPYATSAADRITPLATTAAGRVVPLAQSAAGRVGPLATQAVERVTPYTQQAVDRVTPLAHQAADFVTPLAHQAADFVTPYAQKAAPLAAAARERGVQGVHDAVEAVGPLAAAAKVRGVQGVHDAVETVGPKLEQALASVSPAVEAARGRVTDELLPRVGEVLSTAAAAPVVVEATKRGKATLAAARGELSLPEPPAKRKGRALKRLGIIAVLIGVAAVVVKKMLGSSDADWQAARPTTPYVPATPPAARTTTEPESTPATETAVADAADVTPVDADLPTDAVEPAAQTPATELGYAEESSQELYTDDTVGPADAVVGPEDDLAAPLSADESSDAAAVALDTPESTETPDSTDSTEAGQASTGSGAYVGSEPPEGFVIKGNERSMKYHTPESSNYSQTVAEVWFSSEEAAQEAGFVKAKG